LIANNLDPDLLAIIEYSNECWNNLYVQARWCQDQGLARYPNARPAEAQTFFYVDRALQVFQIFGPRFKHVLCFHFGADRLIREGLLHAAEVGGWNLRSFVDAVAVAPYFGLAVARDPNIAGMTPTQVLYALANTELPRVTAGLAKTVELLAPAKLPLWAYESGQHLVDRQAGEDVQRLFRAVNVDPRMEDLYRAYFQIWLDTVGPTLCMHYSLACKPSRFGYWGMVDSLDQTDSPKLRGFRAALAQGS
jgi:hypothetical protein